MPVCPKAFFCSWDDSGNVGHDRSPSAQRCSFDAGEGPAFSQCQETSLRFSYATFASVG